MQQLMMLTSSHRHPKDKREGGIKVEFSRSRNDMIYTDCKDMRRKDAQ